MIEGPVVPTKQAAKEIYIAIAKAREPKAWRKQPDIFVLDEGATWGVGQDSPVPPVKTWKNAQGKVMETITVSTGGGGLEMEIDKCTGAVAMHYAR
ncbi:MAG: hypothetical protein JOZ72_00840 [Alphaproteobacteria bacterium]|nr:hypothetical protein [Alphaproteobacteria bacterium]